MATILVHRRFLLVAVYTHTQSLGKKYDENLAPCRALSAKWPPRCILMCQALSEDTCVKTGTCAICAWGARKNRGGRQDLNFFSQDLPLLAGKAKERQGRAQHWAKKIERGQS